MSFSFFGYGSLLISTCALLFWFFKEIICVSFRTRIYQMQQNQLVELNQQITYQPNISENIFEMDWNGTPNNENYGKFFGVFFRKKLKEKTKLNFFCFSLLVIEPDYESSSTTTDSYSDTSSLTNITEEDEEMEDIAEILEVLDEEYHSDPPPSYEAPPSYLEAINQVTPPPMTTTDFIVESIPEPLENESIPDPEIQFYEIPYYFWNEATGQFKLETIRCHVCKFNKSVLENV